MRFARIISYRTGWLRVPALVAILVASLCTVGASAPISAEEAVALPQAAGRTTIQWSGIKGIKVELPNDVTVGRDDMTLRVSPGVFGFAAIRANTYDSRPDPFGCDFCAPNRVIWSQVTQSSVAYASGCSPPCSYQAGPLEIYLVSDGEAEVVIDFAGVAGETTLRGTGEVEGGLEPVPVLSCDAEPFTNDCSEYGRGHLVVDVGDDRPVLAMVQGYQNMRHLGSYGGSAIHHERFGRATACAYPGTLWPNESPDPQSHPWGCDEGQPENFFVFLGPLGSVTASNPKARGLQYLGFAARVGHQDLNVQRPGLTGYKGAYGTMAWWIKGGIACPSGDHQACLGPDVPAPLPSRYPWEIPRSQVDRPDEVSGPQIHPVYLLSWDAFDERLDVRGVIEDSMRAQNAWFREQSGGLQWRLDTFRFEWRDPSDPDAEPVEVEAADVTFLRHPRGSFSIPDLLAEYGLNDPDKRYLVYAAAHVSGNCGLSDYPALEETNLIEGFDGRNSVVLLNSPAECRARDFAPGPDEPSFTESIAQHVLLNSEGLVPSVAPHHCGGLVWTGSVCTGPLVADPERDPELNDLMFPFAGLVPLSEQTLDRGNDDYFGHPFPYFDLEDSRYLVRDGI